jgi:hypothetical protein
MEKTLAILMPWRTKKHGGTAVALWGAASTLEGTMRLLLATMFRKVPVRTTKQRATLCKRCGVRIYSLSYLKAHLEAHDRKNH